MEEIIAHDEKAIARLMQSVEAGEMIDVPLFARMVGRSETVVLNAWHNGTLPSGQLGKIPVRESLVALVSCGGLRKDKTKIPEFVLNAEARARELMGLPKREAPEPPDTGGEASAWKLKYLKAQTAARAAAAQATQMRNDIERGTLVKRSEVELDAAETATNIAGALLRIPERVAGMCVGCTAEEIAEILRKEISIALEAIHVSAFTGDWGGVL